MRGRRQAARIAAAPLLAVCALSLGCDRTIGTLEINLLRAAGPGTLPEDITQLLVRIESHETGIDTVEIPLDADGRAQLLDVPAGRDRVIEIQGLTRDGIERARGRSRPIDLISGDNSLDLYFASVGGFSGAAPPVDPVLPGMPRGGHTAVALDDGRVLIVGGGRSLSIDTTSEGTPMATVSEPVFETDLFDPTSGRVTEATAACPTDPVEQGAEPLCLRTGRVGAAIGRSGRGDVLIVGGEDNEGAVEGRVERFPAGRTWSEAVEGLGVRRTGATLVEIADGALLLGGWEGPAGGPASASAVRFAGPSATPVVDDSFLECPRADYEAVVVGDRVVLFGGVDGDEVRQDYEVVRLDPIETLGCEMLAEVAGRRGAAGVAISDDVLVFLGGVTDEGLSSDVDVLDLRNDTFCKVGELNRGGRFLHRAVSLPGSVVFAVGGLRSLPASTGAADLAPRLEFAYVLARLDLAAEQGPGNEMECSDFWSEGDEGDIEWDVEEDAYPDRNRSVPLPPRLLPAVTVMANGMVLVSGGFSPEGDAIDSATFAVFVP